MYICIVWYSILCITCTVEKKEKNSEFLVSGSQGNTLFTETYTVYHFVTMPFSKVFALFFTRNQVRHCNQSRLEKIY